MGIIYDASQKVFQLNTKNSTYLIQISKGGFLLHLYYGAPIPQITDFSRQTGPSCRHPVFPQYHRPGDLRWIPLRLNIPVTVRGISAPVRFKSKG